MPLLLQHPFCCRGYTRAVIQDLLDLYRSKKGDKGYVADPDDDDDDDNDNAAPVDEVRRDENRQLSNKYLKMIIFFAICHCLV